MTYEHTQGAACVLGSRVIVAGGRDMYESGVCEAYDPRSCNDAKKGWQPIGNMVDDRWAFGLVAISEYQALAIGGRDYCNNCLPTILEYDVTIRSFNQSTIHTSHTCIHATPHISFHPEMWV